MSWSELTPVELQAVRMSLHLSVKEASEWIANHTTPRTWQKYEQGTATIPGNIDEEMYVLSQIAEEQFARLHTKAFATYEDGRVIKLRFYRNRADWIKDHGSENPVRWRMHQSVIARVFNELGSCVELT